MAGFSFPLAFVPNYSGKRGYGAKRRSPKGEHPHEGVDLMADVGTPVYAVADGLVVYGPFLFTKQYNPNSFAIVVKHGPLTVLYGEIKEESATYAGTTVNKGEQIGEVAQTGTGSMLHIEIYRGGYTKGGQIDPTSHLKAWRIHLPKPPADDGK